MLARKILIPFLVVLSCLILGEEGSEIAQKNNKNNAWNNGREYQQVKLVFGPRYRVPSNDTVDGRDFHRRFTDSVTDAKRKMAVPVRIVKTTTESSSFFDYFDGKDTDDKDNYEDDDEEEEEEEEDDDDDDDYNDDKKPTKDPKLRGVRRKHVRAHKIIFPLLLAYKLKFFTMLPLLVGSLVLLIGTTGIAGFFFALFSAALGLQVKSHH